MINLMINHTQYYIHIVILIIIINTMIIITNCQNKNKNLICKY